MKFLPGIVIFVPNAPVIQNGVGATGSGYIPFAPGDSSGVQPNIAFDIDGTDYYTTGNIPYAGIAATQQGSD
jgi:hypothetical protein